MLPERLLECVPVVRLEFFQQNAYLILAQYWVQLQLFIWGEMDGFDPVRLCRRVLLFVVVSTALSLSELSQPQKFVGGPGEI